MPILKPNRTLPALRSLLCRQNCPHHVQNQIIEGTSLPLDEVVAGWCYLAGPMRGIAHYNFPAFDAARDHWLARGYAVISPADIDRAAGGETDRPGHAEGFDEPDQSAYVYRDFHAIYLLSQLPEPGLLVMLPGWERSVGATAEFRLAEWLKLSTLIAEPAGEGGAA